MITLGVGSFRVCFTSERAGNIKVIKSHYGPWISEKHGADVECSFDDKASVQKQSTENSSHFVCHSEDDQLVFVRGPLRVRINTAPDVWKCSANLDQYVYWMKDHECEKDGTDGVNQARVENEYVLFGFNLVLRAVSMAWSFYHDSVILHSSTAAATDGGCFVFSGPMNSGKSTASSCCRDFRLISEDCVEICTADDIHPACFSSPVNNIEKQGGFPFSGPARGIFFVKKSKRVSCTRIDQTEALRNLYNNAMMDCIVPGKENEFLKVLSRISEKVSCFYLEFTRDCKLDQVVNDALEELD